MGAHLFHEEDCGRDTDPLLSSNSCNCLSSCSHSSSVVSGPLEKLPSSSSMQLRKSHPFERAMDCDREWERGVLPPETL